MASIPISVWPYNVASLIWFGIVTIILFGAAFFPGNERALAYIIVFLFIMYVIDTLILEPIFEKVFQRDNL